MLNIKKIFYIIVLSALITGQAVADKGEEAYQQGQKLQNGTGDAEENNKRAAEAYQKAAETGHLRAMNDLALMYLKGTGVSKDPAKARELYKSAAEKDLDISQYQLAELMRKGEGGDEDIDGALKWYKRAADQGNVTAMMKLGELYADDENGVKADYPRAYAWYALAKEYGGYVSTGRLELIERNMAPNDMDKAEKLVRKLAPSQDRS